MVTRSGVSYSPKKNQVSQSKMKLKPSLKIAPYKSPVVKNLDLQNCGGRSEKISLQDYDHSINDSELGKNYKKSSIPIYTRTTTLLTGHRQQQKQQTATKLKNSRINIRRSSLSSLIPSSLAEIWGIRLIPFIKTLLSLISIPIYHQSGNIHKKKLLTRLSKIKILKRFLVKFLSHRLVTKSVANMQSHLNNLKDRLLSSVQAVQTNKKNILPITVQSNNIEKNVVFNTRDINVLSGILSQLVSQSPSLVQSISSIPVKINPVRGVIMNDTIENNIPTNVIKNNRQISCLFTYLSTKVTRLSTFDFYDWHKLQPYIESNIKTHTDISNSTTDQYFVLFSINKWILVLTKKFVLILIDNGFFFNRPQNVIACYFCGIIYTFNQNTIDHYEGCIYKTCTLNETIKPIIVRAHTFEPLYPVYNQANWNDSFTSMRYGTQVIMSGALEQFFTIRSNSFLFKTNNNKNTSLTDQFYNYETLRSFGNFLSVKYNFYKEACIYVDTYIRKTAHRINPLVRKETFNNNNDILDSFNYPTSGTYAGRIKLNCPVCLGGSTHILSCGHSFCMKCLSRCNTFNPNICQFCRAVTICKPIKIIFNQ